MSGSLILNGFMALAAIGLFISVTRLCYRIEARSNGDNEGQTSALPRFANVPRVVINYHIARDAETQAMRKTLLIRLGIILAIFAVLAIARNAMPPTLPAPLV